VKFGPIVKAVVSSTNEKIGGCATTYAAQASCPDSCVFKDGGGCYAENGRIAMGMTIPLNEAAAGRGVSALDVARAEADAIDQMVVRKGRPLRLHTVGDCPTDECARIVSAAAERYMQRGGGPVWTYTHAWREVNRDSWGTVHVLASCETPLDVKLAHECRYATSVTLEDFPGRKLFHMVWKGRTVGTSWTEPAVKVIPCPAQTTEGVTCASCRLCMDTPRLREQRLTIGFAVHGTASVAKAAVKALRDPHDLTRKLTSRDWALFLRDELGEWPTANALAKAAGVTWPTANEMLGKLRSCER
jgi:hypothetical protein